MIKFPVELDTDSEIQRVDANTTEVIADTVNDIRDAVFAIERSLGVSAAGNKNSLSERVNVSIDADGNIKPSALSGFSVISGQIDDHDIKPSAGIKESKLSLDVSTSNLNSQIGIIGNTVNYLNTEFGPVKSKLSAHLDSKTIKHNLEDILVYDPSTPIGFDHFVDSHTNLRIDPLTHDVKSLLLNINTDLVKHERANGGTISTPTDGHAPPNNYAHNATGIHIDDTGFGKIHGSDLQTLASNIDSVTLGLSKLTDQISNGISRKSSISSLSGTQDYLFTNVPAKVLDENSNVFQFDVSPSGYTFDEKFNKISPGDYLEAYYVIGSDLFRVDYIIDSTYVSYAGLTRTFLIRVNGISFKTVTDSSLLRISIVKSSTTTNKYSILATASANNIYFDNVNKINSGLIIVDPRCASVVGIGFNPTKLNSTHYNLYLQLYYNNLTTPVKVIVDITGNQGITPGKYTLQTCIDTFNNYARLPGNNLRFVAFEYQGEFGIALADYYQNASFSIISGVINSIGSGYDKTASDNTYPNNVIGVDGIAEFTDPLGLGPNNANVASPAQFAFTSYNSTKFYTKIYNPVLKNYCSISGNEIDSLADIGTSTKHVSSSGNYWSGTVSSVINIPNGNLEVEYTINQCLSDLGIVPGKTIVVLPSTSTSNYINYGRFVVKKCVIENCGSTQITKITVCDARHAKLTGVTYVDTIVGDIVNIYYSSDSILFDSKQLSEIGDTNNYKRYFEIYSDKNGNIFPHERAKFVVSNNEISKINFFKVSQKFKENVVELNILEYTNQFISGTLNNGNVVNTNNKIIRLYNDSNIDFMEFGFDDKENVLNFTHQGLTIKVFKTLQLDQELFLIATCQYKDFSTNNGTDLTIRNIEDRRQFGNISEKQLSTSFFDYLSSYRSSVVNNSVISGFDISATINETNRTLDTKIYMEGGRALVNGKEICKDKDYVSIPPLKLTALTPVAPDSIEWAICLNDIGEFEIIPINYLNTITVCRYNEGFAQSFKLKSYDFVSLSRRKDIIVLYTFVK